MRCGCGAVSFIFSIYFKPVLYAQKQRLNCIISHAFTSKLNKEQTHHTYSGLQKFWKKKENNFLQFLKSVDLNCHFQTICIEIRRHETWNLIFDPFNLIHSISLYWKLVTLYWMSWNPRISRLFSILQLVNTFSSPRYSV